MKYYSVSAVNADGSENTLKFDHVSAWSLKGLTSFFALGGVVLKPTYAYSIDDRPVYVSDPVTEEYLKNNGEVV